MSSLTMFAARTICGGRYFDFYRNTARLFMRDFVDVIDNFSGCLGEAQPKKYLSIKAHASRFGVIPYSPPRGALSSNTESTIGGSYFRRDKSMRYQHEKQIK